MIKKKTKTGGIAKKKPVTGKKKPVVTRKKAEKALKKTGSFLANNQKPLLYVGGAVLGIFVGYKIYKGISDAINNVVKAPKTDYIEAPLEIDESEVTISENKATLLAKTLLDAFNHQDFLTMPDTDEEKIDAVFDEIKSGDDYKMVFKAFGRRPHTWGGTPTSWVDKQLLSSEEDLNFWLKNELDATYDKTLYEKVKSRAESAGMIF